MPHYKHDCMDPCCCHYVGSGDVINGDDKLRYFDVYVYTAFRNTPHEQKSLNIRVGDEGWDYHNTTLEHARQSAAGGDNALYAAALKVYDAYVTRTVRDRHVADVARDMKAFNEILERQRAHRPRS